MENWPEKLDAPIASLGLRRSSIICKPKMDLSVAEMRVVMSVKGNRKEAEVEV